MPWPSTPNRIATRIGLTIGGGSAGWLTTLLVIHKRDMAVIALVAVIVALAVNAIEPVLQGASGILSTPLPRQW